MIIKIISSAEHPNITLFILNERNLGIARKIAEIKIKNRNHCRPVWHESAPCTCRWIFYFVFARVIVNIIDPLSLHKKSLHPLLVNDATLKAFGLQSAGDRNHFSFDHALTAALRCELSIYHANGELHLFRHKILFLFGNCSFILLYDMIGTCVPEWISSSFIT